ncbi:uncharacterized protein LOC129906980 isoform X2 [Episyrphus balteatus]|uniref:uncharacterized protein LOC129906980 isoform X2 n=1 Tax=Episyrphus balteatus TaxID=286459 RepID=UPI00248605AC|nr:uncharacterized protein LOC129906980 isoform X2 [Episyrphus balteatus]
MQDGSQRGPREDTLPNAVIQEDARWTPLHEAAAIGDDKRLQALLTANADRTAKESRHGNTPLHEAAWRGFSRCVKILCAPPNPKKDQKDKKLKGVLQETRGALHSALLGIRNDGGFSALHLAAQNGHNQSCREILLAGGDPDIQNNYGDTALHTACRYGHAGATRILLSASCDSNKANLNGDTPLHIACAMGRRKLTRILLEAGSNTTLQNSQHETARDISTRKNYNEIIQILDNPKKHRRNKDKSSGSGEDRHSGQRKGLFKGDHVDGMTNPVSWSPYGCHYFPDPSSFPSPKLDTLPKEPLKKGEQYFLDLAGNICKGPVGVGNTCYCGPFFRHMEDKINKNRKSLRKYVFKATERLDSKVQALAIRTDDQIEQLTRSMIADRIRCESRRLHLEHWLKRGEPCRVTTAGHQSRSRNKSHTLSRCKSLEFLEDESMHGSKMQNSKSFDVLEEAQVTVHRDAEVSDDDGHISVTSLGRGDRDEERWGRLETDYFNVSERLEELLAKTNEILEMEKEASKKRKEELLAFTEPTVKRRERKTQNVLSMGKDIIEQLQQVSLEEQPTEDLNQITVLPLEDDTSRQDQIAPGLSEATNDYASYLSTIQTGRASQQSASCPLQEKYQSFSQIHSNENMLHDVITAIRKDHQMVKELIESETLNEMENTHEDKLSYKDEQTLLNVNGFFQNTCFEDGLGDSPSNSIKAENKVTMTSMKNISELCEKPFEIPTYAELNKLKPRADPSLNQSKDWRRKAIKNSNKQLEDLPERVNGTIKKVEIKNSEIKTLKKPSILKRNKVQELVARLQGKLSSSVTVKSTERDDSSESSEDDHNEQNEANQLEDSQMQMGAYTSYRQPQMNSPNNSAIVSTNNMIQTNSSLYSTIIPNNSYPYRLIPKDAYFHELPNRGRPNLQPHSFSNQSEQQIQQSPLSLPNNYYHHHQQHQNIQNQHQQQQHQTWSRISSERQMPVNLQMQQKPSLLNHSYPSPYNNMPPIMVHTPPQPLRPPVAERLLSNRKFMPLNSISPDYELAGVVPVNIKNCNQMQNANILIQQSSTAGLINSMDHNPQHMVERDVSNDSGFSTRIYGGGSESHRPSPSLSGHTDYGGMHSPSHGVIYPSGHVQTEVGDMAYYMANVSSLV